MQSAGESGRVFLRPQSNDPLQCASQLPIRVDRLRIAMYGDVSYVQAGPIQGFPDLRPAARRIPQLSEREHQVLLLLATGGTNHAISRRLGVAEGTIKAHVGRILLKLGLESRTAAAVTAVSYLNPCPCAVVSTGMGESNRLGSCITADPVMPKV
ncbi:helix-turn-helix transcriptional regulator [Streptomyces sp. NBC_01669]|uniref:response regulator transcription factor n=1 Tax=Streptomyces sp. NBC_01669 TaxID=2975909 RepID=UPI002B1CBF5E|nr:helix-turn-helix transcriptional regulator [Streptomyces sp. NBC_01669]